MRTRNHGEVMLENKLRRRRASEIIASYPASKGETDASRVPKQAEGLRRPLGSVSVGWAILAGTELQTQTCHCPMIRMSESDDVVRIRPPQTLVSEPDSSK